MYLSDAWHVTIVFKIRAREIFRSTLSADVKSVFLCPTCSNQKRMGIIWILEQIYLEN